MRQKVSFSLIIIVAGVFVVGAINFVGMSFVFAKNPPGIWLFQADPTRKPLFQPESKYYCNDEHNKCISKLPSCYYDRDESFDQCLDDYRSGEKQCTDRLAECVVSPDETEKPKPASEADQVIPSEKPEADRCGFKDRFLLFLPGFFNAKRGVSQECLRQDGVEDVSEAEPIEEEEEKEDFVRGVSGLDYGSEFEAVGLLEKLQNGDNVFVEIEKIDGGVARVGVVRTLDGTYLYTKDGVHYYSSMRRAFQPSLIEKGVEGVLGVLSAINPINWVRGTSIPDSYEGEHRKEKEKIARETLKNFRKRLGNSDGSKKFIQGVAKFVIEKGLGKGIGLPAGVVSGSFDEANITQYENSARVYMAEREKNGRSLENLIQFPPQEITYKLPGGKEDELGGRAILYASFEEAYQRYLLSQKFE